VRDKSLHTKATFSVPDMKLVSRDVSGKDGEGTVVLRPEEPEDMWAIYNLISEGDLVRTTTFRKVVKESATGSTTSSKIRLNLTIQVERVQFDPDTCVLRLSGRNREESEHVKVRKENDRGAHSHFKLCPARPISQMGAYHTLDLELQRNFTIQKTCWDTVVLDRLDEACDPVKQAEVAAIVMQPGLANICLLTGSMTIVRQRIDVRLRYLLFDSGLRSSLLVAVQAIGGWWNSCRVSFSSFLSLS